MPTVYQAQVRTRKDFFPILDFLGRKVDAGIDSPATRGKIEYGKQFRKNTMWRKDRN